MNMVYYCSLRLIIFLVKCIHTGVKKQMEDFREWKQLENLGYLGICITLCTVALFFRSVSWKRGADEPGSK